MGRDERTLRPQAQQQQKLSNGKRKRRRRGAPPEALVTRGLMLELESGMWLHEALRSRLLREVGAPLEERARKLRESPD